MAEVMHWHKLTKCPVIHWRLAYSDRHVACATCHCFHGQWDWTSHGQSGLAATEQEAMEAATNAFLEYEITGG